MRQFAGILQVTERSSKVLCRLCTAEVRGSNPLGSTLKNRVLQVKRESNTHSGSLAGVSLPTIVVLSLLNTLDAFTPLRMDAS
jgi:hypothetical protein